MSDSFRTPFKDKVTQEKSFEVKPNLGQEPDSGSLGKTTINIPSVQPAPLPANTLKFGTPDSK